MWPREARRIEESVAEMKRGGGSAGELRNCPDGAVSPHQTVRILLQTSFVSQFHSTALCLLFSNMHERLFPSANIPDMDLFHE